MQKTDTGLTPAHAYIPRREEKCIPFKSIKTVIQPRWASSCFRTLASKPSIRTSGRWHLRSNSAVSPPYGCFHWTPVSHPVSSSLPSISRGQPCFRAGLDLEEQGSWSAPLPSSPSRWRDLLSAQGTSSLPHLPGFSRPVLWSRE